MKQIADLKLQEQEAAVWWLGQAGYVVRCGGTTVVIDPYLSDAAAAGAPEFTRLYAAPIPAGELEAAVYIVTHDHLDHLDPDTIQRYAFKQTTWFIAPRQAAKKLAALGVPEARIVVLHAGETWKSAGVQVQGVYAVPTGADVLDTTGYRVSFANGRNLYHTSDTEYHPLVVAAAPRQPELMLVPINGKWGNPGPDKAAQFAAALQPRYVMPNHYDLMELNAENPEAFKWFCKQQGLTHQCIIPRRMQPFVWNHERIAPHESFM